MIVTELLEKRLVGRKITGICSKDDGNLQLVFEGGHTLDVEAVGHLHPNAAFIKVDILDRGH